MEITFQQSDDHGEDLRSLHAWLLDDQELRGQVRVEPVTGRPSSEHMAGDLEAIVAIISGVSAVVQLGISVAAWREARGGRRQNIVIVVSEIDRDAAKPVIDALKPEENE
ncbi:hypothetical protein ABGB17_04100 [Sphaerisporangium sp. B11E5]|uniref:effector-associated constant component EACC1 n=1 Tax=Sphaerisporangium sp. B11E5 TaxID=3153563 RepID=UPI00325C769E